MSLVKLARARRWFMHEILIIAYGIVLLFLCVSLAEFHLYSVRSIDHPWPDLARIGCWSGYWGIVCARSLFYVCGVASWFVLLSSVLFLYWFVLIGRSFTQEVDRIACCVLMVPLVDSFCSVVAKTDSAGIASMSGLSSRGIVRLLYPSFGYYGALIILYVLILSCSLVLLRFYKIDLVALLVHRVHSGIATARERRIMYHAVLFLVRCGLMIGIFFHAVAQMIKKIFHYFFLLDGTLVVDDYDQVEEALSHAFERNVSDAHTTEINTDHITVEQPEQKSIAQQIFNAITTPKTVKNKKASGYKVPTAHLFSSHVVAQSTHIDAEELKMRARLLEEKLEKFGVRGSVVSIKTGPVVALFEYQPRIDIKLSKILALEDDLALALEALSIRIIAPIPGTAVVGFEVAHKKRLDVPFVPFLQSTTFARFQGALPIILGQSTTGEQLIVDLARMPHLLMAGSTGSGKSVALNCMLMSLLCRFCPQELQLVLIDPKRLEFAMYADLPHLLFPVVIDPKKVASVLRWIIGEMEQRYERMATIGVRNIHDYNVSVAQHRAGGEMLSFIVVVIDELADLMITTGREIEDLIARIAQMARAAGIHCNHEYCVYI